MTVLKRKPRAYLCMFLLAAIAAASVSAQASEPDWKKLTPLLQKSQQLVWVEPSSTFRSSIKLYEKKQDRWQLIELASMPSEFPVVIGLLGFANPGQKAEGDKKSPTGLYSFGRFFGKNDQTFLHWKYQRVTVEDKWIDDATHPDYNKWIVGNTTAKSFENLLRQDEVYDLAAVINYNMNPIKPGAGSAIFMHIWRGSLIGTAGCVAMNKENLEKVLRWLDQNKNPQILMGDVN
jgi:L,D-peptidoglycan transpeptidase YkuD (ErfK/YbiS/YcfS/YnhG family)